ncbi:MAG TPA: hypothetical protein PLP29_16640 [Candidatus Ozemobacteraceae bacterium]|nr:hypothetical protein [Candidatus Ozemobacteraceae bacterium]
MLLRAALAVMALLMMIPTTAYAGPSAPPDCPVIREIAWGTATECLGIIFQDRGQLPEGPFMGPGGFRVDAQGGIWVSDSVGKAVKLFPADGGAVRAFPVNAAKLGDLWVSAAEIVVVTGSPDGIAVIDRESGREIRRIDAPIGTPGRLTVFTPERIALGRADGGVMMFIDGKPELHPAGALEPVGTSETLYGTLYEFDVKSRVVIRAAWTGEASDPETFARYTVPSEDRIVFSRLLGMSGGLPVLLLVTKADPSVYRLVRLDADGKPASEAILPILPGSPLPSSWIQGEDGQLYAAEADERAFRIRRGPAMN